MSIKQNIHTTKIALDLHLHSTKKELIKYGAYFDALSQIALFGIIFFDYDAKFAPNIMQVSTTAENYHKGNCTKFHKYLVGLCPKAKTIEL